MIVVHGLKEMDGQLQTAIRTSRLAWPHVVNGLSRDPAELGRAQVAQAAADAEAVKVPFVFSEAGAAELTGPGSPIAGVLRTFAGLVPRGWKLIGAAIAEIEDGPAVASAFARETVALYIESVYDGYFSLAQAGKKLIKGYQEMGGPEGLAGRLSQAEVESLANFYSEATFRLHPHPGVKLGS